MTVRIVCMRGVGALGLILAAVSPASAQTADSTATSPGSQEPPPSAPAPHHPRVSIQVAVEESGRRNPLGNIVIELYPEDAPRHVETFLAHVKENFYQNLTFHRIVPAFIVQGGDPISKENWTDARVGTGGPTEGIPAEIGRPHVRGSVAAARKPDALNPTRESSGSQFYICLADLPALDRGGYTVFGQVVEGMDVVDKISRVKNSGPNANNRALQRVLMTQVKALP
jgi:cyclophilin family peptidyl-prolyl cis-trans isomerase